MCTGAPGCARAGERARYRGRVTAAPQAGPRADSQAPVDSRVACRFCGRTAGDLVLDLGKQPSSELFPAAGAPGPDPLLPRSAARASAIRAA